MINKYSNGCVYLTFNKPWPIRLEAPRLIKERGNVGVEWNIHLLPNCKSDAGIIIQVGRETMFGIGRFLITWTHEEGFKKYNYFATGCGG